MYNSFIDITIYTFGALMRLQGESNPYPLIDSQG
jgi:hypothetical protein